MKGGRDFMSCRGNLDSLHGGRYGMNGWSSYSGNSHYYHIFHQLDREKLKKMSFLNITNKLIPTVEFKSDFFGDYQNGNLFDMEIEFILVGKYLTREIYNKRSQLIYKHDFDNLIKIAKVIIELIEFVRPEIILMSHDQQI